MLHPDLPAFIAAASARGIATRVNTNLSVRSASRDAERLVESGLTDLFVSIDGATQEVYERYRVGGDLGPVIANCRLLAEAKRRLRKTSPRLTLQFLQFPCNADEGDAMRRLAAELDMRLFAFRGASPRPGLGRPMRLAAVVPAATRRALPLPVGTAGAHRRRQHRAVPRRVPELRRLHAASRRIPETSGRGAFAGMEPRALPRRREGCSAARTGHAAERALPCYECPTTIFHERWRAHRAGGGTLEDFDPGMPLNANGAWNYFWARGQRRTAPAPNT